MNGGNEIKSWSQLEYMTFLYFILWGLIKKNEKGEKFLYFLSTQLVKFPLWAFPSLPSSGPRSALMFASHSSFYSLVHWLSFNYECSPMHLFFWEFFILVFQLGLRKPQKRHAPQPLLWFPARRCSGWLLSSLLSAVSSTCSWPPQSQRTALVSHFVVVYSTYVVIGQGGTMQAGPAQAGPAQTVPAKCPSLHGPLCRLCGWGFLFYPFLFLPFLTPWPVKSSAMMMWPCSVQK